MSEARKTGLSRSCAKAPLVVRDDKKLLPLSKDKKNPGDRANNPLLTSADLYSHAHMFCEQMVKHSTNLIPDDAPFHAEEEDIEEALRLAKEADLVVMTNYYARIEKARQQYPSGQGAEGRRPYGGCRYQLPVQEGNNYGSRCCRM